MTYMIHCRLLIVLFIHHARRFAECNRFIYTQHTTLTLKLTRSPMVTPRYKVSDSNDNCVTVMTNMIHFVFSLYYFPRYTTFCRMQYTTLNLELTLPAILTILKVTFIMRNCSTLKLFYRVGHKVQYNSQARSDLLGSAQRCFFVHIIKIIS